MSSNKRSSYPERPPSYSSYSDAESYPNRSSSVLKLKGLEHAVSSKPLKPRQGPNYLQPIQDQTGAVPYTVPEQSIQSIDTVAQSTDQILRTTVGDDREGWGHKVEFLLASIGLAVGLGNVWRFPYLCQKNGGGIFLIPYVIFMIIEGLPLFFIEYAIGQRMRRSSISCWKNVHASLTGIGISCVVVSFMLSIYYVVVIAWCFYYMFVSFTKLLPWDKSLCPRYSEYQSLNKTLQGNFSHCCVHDPSQYYFYEKALRVSSGIGDSGSGINGPLVGCLALSWVVTFACIVKGVKSSGKAVYFTATFPYVILIIFFFRGVTLPGAEIGIKAFFKPELKKLFKARIWLDAATQMFFTLSLGFGALIAFASYMPRKNNCIRDAYTVVLINCGTSIFAGVVVFSILGHRQLKTGTDATKVGSGPGLAFITFCEAITLMDVSPLWSVLFFMMLILLGIDSEFGTLEAAITPLYDMKLIPIRKDVFTAIVAFIFFLLGIALVSSPGYYIFQIFDDYSVSLPLLIIAFCQIVAMSWVYGNDRLANDIKYMTGKRPFLFWMVCWKYISPIAIFIVLIASIAETSKDTAKYKAYAGCIQNPFSSVRNGTAEWTAQVAYPGWAQFIIAIVVLSCILPIFLWMFAWMFRHRNGTWRTRIYDKLTGGLVEYHPDPARVDPSRRKSMVQMERIIQEEDAGAN
eukprot:gene7057-7849_t